jgi:gliding motility-associated-like protein
MEEKDFIKELFQEKLAQHQSPVRPDLWASVSSSISTGSAAANTGFSILTKFVIGGISAAAVVGSVWLMNQPKSTTTKKPLINVTRPIEKTETTKTEIPGTTSNKQKEAPQLQLPPIPTYYPVDDNPTFGPGISLTNNDPEVIPMPPMQTIVSNQNITTISENPIATVPLTLETEPVSNVQEEVLILPNIFTPNGDGKNDELSIDLSAFEFVDYSLVILDGKNQIVFKSNDPNESWNGKKLDGDMCPAGSYVYYLTGKTSNDKTISKYASLRIQY